MFPLASRVILKVRTVDPDAPLGSGTGGAISLTVLIGTVTVSVSAIAGEDSNKTTNPIRIAVARPTAFMTTPFKVVSFVHLTRDRLREGSELKRHAQTRPIIRRRKSSARRRPFMSDSPRPEWPCKASPTLSGGNGQSIDYLMFIVTVLAF